ncbi:MAG: hypothetical protein Q8M06_02645 [Methanobacteriaceae archaeon]|nr:hypothetical protein [Methanobacteriaceae archaeon]
MVYNPDDGSILVANIDYVGSIYSTSGINREGLFLKKNDGDVAYERLQAQNKTSNVTNSSKKIDTYLELFQLVQKSANTTELDKNFANATTTIGCIINVADKTGAYSYEWIPGKYQKNPPHEYGILVATNEFIDPSWGLEITTPGSSSDTGQSILRIINLFLMNNKYKESITPDVMMQIISTPISDGGPFFPTYTSYQMVVVPENLTIWFKVTNYLMNRSGP